MPIIKEMSNTEKIILMYKGKKHNLNRTNYNSRPSESKITTSVKRYYQQSKPKDNKFKSNSHLFQIKFDDSFPKISLKMETIYLNRESQMTPFAHKKVSRHDLERILKWGIFYNKKTKRFTVPCGGALYHYEIYLCLFRSHLLPLGLYRYNPQSYTLGLIKKGGFIKSAVDVLNCYFDRLTSASGVILIISNPAESKQKYDFLSERIIPLDVGHLMHSFNLSFTACGYGVSNIAGGINRKVIQFLGENENSNYIASLYFGGRSKGSSS